MASNAQPIVNTLEAAIAETSQSLLDQIVAKQADVASRYQPVMSVEQSIKRMVAIKQLKDLVLKEGEDFGVIPGTDKPTLLKPGAEKICASFGYVPNFIALPGSIEDWVGAKFGEPLFYYHMQCTLLKDGAAVGQGQGSCNSWESKYRYRWIPESAIPEGVDKTQLLTRGGKVVEFEFAISKAETVGQYGKPAEYWTKWNNAIESGEARRITKATKTGKEMAAWEMDGTNYRVPNEQFADTINTVQKMADKRAYIAATLSATGASQWFTQDMEDQDSMEEIKRQAAKQDTGGHTVGTKEASDHVAQQKLAALQNKPTNSGSNRTAPETTKGVAPLGDKSQGAADNAPVAPSDPLTQAEAEFRAADKFGKLRYFGYLKKDIEELTGSDHSYYEILGHHEVKKCDQFTTVGKAIACYREMWRYVAKCSKVLEPPPEPQGNTYDAESFVEGLDSEVTNARS